MKDFIYNDIKGLESQNTQQQLDTFEAVRLMGGKDRFIIDFSTPLVQYPPTSGGNNRLYTQYWDNAAYWDKKWDTRLGVPGDAQLFYKNFLNYGSSPQYPSIPKVQTILGDDITETTPWVYEGTIPKGAPYFNENAGIFIGSKFAGIYGEGGSLTNPDAISSIRSGYYEFTIKTDKENCIIGYGVNNKQSSYPVAIDSNSISIPDGAGNVTEFKILIENKKLKIKYENYTGNNQVSFEIIGNKDIADNEWHHIVINLGKPGVKRTHSKKYNKKFIEFWIDGQLDKRTDEYINNQIFFPTVTWLFVDPTLSFAIDNPNWLTIDYPDQNEYGQGDSIVQDVLGPFVTDLIVLGNNEVEYFNGHDQGVFNEKGASVAFRGAIHTYVAGYNQCLDAFEIKFRNNLWRGIEKSKVNQFTAKCTMVNPTVSTNKKKTLKLFWNNLLNLNSQNGIELDNNYTVNTMSITHKVANSITDIYNIDTSNNHSLQFLNDVRVVVKDNIIILRPGAVWIQNFADIAVNVGTLYQSNMYDESALNGMAFPNLDFRTLDYTQKIVSQLSTPSIEKISISGVNLVSGDRILLTNQFDPSENGIYIFDTFDSPLKRAEDANSASKLNNAVVRVIDGYYKDTSWFLSNNISTLNQKQNWIELELHPSEDTIMSQPIFSTRWLSENGEERFIDLQQDINIEDYDLIVFMNYPKNNEEIKEHFIGYDDFEIKIKYDNFIKSLTNVVANGASLYVSSPRLAQDLGIVKAFTEVPQLLQDSDAAAASLSPFELTEPAERYFDTHRNNKYNVATTIPGLTNKETYLLTDFINFTPETQYDFDQYHAKYSYRQFGLQEGNEFIIPGTALRKITENESLPGYKDNQLGTKPLMAVEPYNILTGTVVTKLANNYYNGSTITANPYDDYATTIVVYNGQLLGGIPINGKIFVNCIEDGYTFSREEYNKAKIQVLPETDTNETIATRAWQYSTTRLDRKPQTINVSGLTILGQTTPTNGGGGAFIQAPTNSSNGIIRSQKDKENIDYKSDLYPTEEEEIYPLQEIPVLSMTWLGLQWLAG